MIGALIAARIDEMRLVHLAIALGLVTATTACAKKQAAAPAKPTPSNTEPAATGGSAPAQSTPASDKTSPDSGSRGPVNKGGDPCEGGQ